MATTPPTADHQLRDSQKLLAHLAKNGETPSVEAIKQALGLHGEEKLRIPNWLIRGIPPAYLDVVGTLEVDVEGVADVVKRLIQLNDSTINLKILINGIPYPDVAQIVIRNTPSEE